MNVRDFLEQSAGEWLTQRTHHHLAVRQFEGGKIALTIEFLAAANPTLTQICPQWGIETAQIVGGIAEQWSGNFDFNSQAIEGQSLLVLTSTDTDQGSGQVWRSRWPLATQPSGGNTQPAASGTYQFGDDRALVLQTNYNSALSEERIWFASENLRLRSTVLRQEDGFNSASLSSEIRKLTAPKPSP